MSGTRLLLSLTLLASSTAWGQIPYNACLDRKGQVIPGVVDNTLPYAGVATEQNGKPVILWNQKSNQLLSTTEQIFVYLHECAHHTLGHVRGDSYTPAVELEADCWAIQLMVDGGMIKGRHLAELERSRRTVRGDRYHLGGEAHIQSLERCLEIRTDPNAWAQALSRFVLAAQDSFASQRGRLIETSPDDTLYQSLVDAPGTYDCELVGPAARCLLFAARKPKAAEQRFERLVKIIRGWLPVGWSSIERAAPEGGERSYLAQDGMTGTLITLTQRGARVYLLVKRLQV